MDRRARHDGYRQVLACRDFRLLWIGQSLSYIGNRMVPVVLVVLVLDRGAAAIDIGLVLGALSLAAVIGGLLASAVSDRWRRTRLMIGADVVRFAGVIALAVGGGGAPTWFLLAAVLLVGAGEGLFLPAFGAIVPRLLPPSLVQGGNALNQVAVQAAALAGPALAGAIVAMTSARAALSINAATFVFSLASLALIREQRLPAGPHTPGAARHAMADFRDGVRAVTQRRWVASSLGMATIIQMLVIPPVYVVLALLTNDRLGGPGGYGAVLAVAGLGSMAGVLVIGRLSVRRPGLVATAWMFAAIGMPISLIALPLPGVLLCWAVGGLGMGVYNLLWITALQRDVPDHLLGRVLALDGLVSDALQPVGYALTGLAIAAAGARDVLTAGIVLIALVVPLPMLVRGGVTFSTPSAFPQIRKGTEGGETHDARQDAITEQVQWSGRVP